MQENESITIDAVENGWIVRHDMREGYATSMSTTKVFRSMNELNRFMGEHFTHRAKGLEGD